MFNSNPGGSAILPVSNERGYKMEPIEGSCLCGQVRYQFSGDMKVFQYCHCSRCRKVSGSAHCANLLIDPQGFKWLSGEGSVGRFEPADTRHFATSFCRNCGSTLPWLSKSGKVVVIPAGGLDQDPGIQPSQNIFCDSAASWYKPASELPSHETLPNAPTS